MRNIPAKLDKMPDGALTSLQNARLCDLNTPTASTITARYHKGASGHKDNLVITMEQKNDTEKSLIKLNDNTVVEVRIRRLTERECLRFMDVEEDDIDKMAKVNSATQLYKQAGNSIVNACLRAMFSQLGIAGVKKWNDEH